MEVGVRRLYLFSSSDARLNVFGIGDGTDNIVRPVGQGVVGNVETREILLSFLTPHCNGEMDNCHTLHPKISYGSLWAVQGLYFCGCVCARVPYINGYDRYNECSLL